MILTEEDKKFLKDNKKILESLFIRRIEELKDNIFNMPIETKEQIAKREIEIRFVNEYKVWLEDIGLLEKEPKKSEPPTGV